MIASFAVSARSVATCMFNVTRFQKFLKLVRYQIYFFYNSQIVAMVAKNNRSLKVRIIPVIFIVKILIMRRLEN